MNPIMGCNGAKYGTRPRSAQFTTQQTKVSAGISVCRTWSWVKSSIPICSAAGVVDLIDWLKVPHMLKTSSTFGVHTLFTLELPRGESTLRCPVESSLHAELSTSRRARSLGHAPLLCAPTDTKRYVTMHASHAAVISRQTRPRATYQWHIKLELQRSAAIACYLP